jgi:hypothetical protein
LDANLANKEERERVWEREGGTEKVMYCHGGGS